VLSDFAFGKVLGTGGFAVVKEAKHIRTKAKYAVKIMNVAVGADAEAEGMSIEEIAEEIRLTMSLQHENVVKIHDFYQTATHVYVIMELLEGGELLDAVMELGSYNEKDAATIMKQLFTGLESVHSKSMAHRDLKLENLILAKKKDLSSLRIADFGLAKKMKTARGKLSAQCGSPAYVAPEVITGQQYTPAVDMWASGCIMYSLLCGELPFYEDDEQAMFRRIAKGKMHAPGEDISKDGMDLLNKLLCVDKVQRLTAVEALEHKWITGLLSSKDIMSKTVDRSRMQRFAESKMKAELEVRHLKKGDLLIKQGDRAKEVFLIKEGSCEVVLEGADGKEMKVAERHAGEFVGEMGVKTKADGSVNADAAKIEPESPSSKKKADAKKGNSSSAIEKGVLSITTLLRVKNTWLGGRRGANVRATTDMKVLVMSSHQMQWILEHDYGVDGEVTSTIQGRKKELERTKTMVGEKS
jgi:serine/threonine protein kinase